MTRMLARVAHLREQTTDELAQQTEVTVKDFFSLD